MSAPSAGEFTDALNVYVAEITADTAEAYTAATPEFLGPLGQIASETDSQGEPRYYGGKVYYYSQSEGPTKVTVLIPGVNLKTKAKILGKKYSTSSKRYADSGKANAPFYALGYSSKVADVGGGDHLVMHWFLKGIFASPKMEAATSTNELDPKTTELEYTAIPTAHEFVLDGVTGPLKGFGADGSDDPSITEAAWFAAVQNPNQPAITVSAQPADASKTAGAITGAVSVTAAAASGTLAYQWYTCDDDESYDGFAAISGANTSSYTIPTTLTAATYNYFCRLSIVASGVTMFTDIATITVT